MKGSEQQDTTTKDTANQAASGNGADTTAHQATIDQVRDLLFGGAQRSLESNLDGLRQQMEAAVKQLQAEFARDLAALQAKVTELERDTEQKRLASHRDIGAAISQLGATISELGSGRAGK